MRADFTAEFRFYGSLNDFLALAQRQLTMRYRFSGNPGIKDPIEALGVPHTEVELIIVNGEAVGFDYQLKAADRVAVFPVFHHLDISPVLCLREPLTTVPCFVLDVNLGKLVKRLRMLGFDCLYRNDYHDAEIADIAADEQRIVLTRDRRLLFAKRITYGYWVRAVHVHRQVEEVIRRFDLQSKIRPFKRCLICNGLLASVAKADVLEQLEPKTRLYYEYFYRCVDCGQIYWEGSHIDDMRQRFDALFPSTQ